MNKYLKNKWYVLIFAGPGVVLFTLFVFVPLISNIWLGMQNTDGLTSSAFVGIENFIKGIKDQRFNNANIKSLFLMVLNIGCTAFISIIFAIILNELDERVSKTLRTAYLMPMVLSITVICQMWLAIYNPDWGLLNTFLKAVNLGGLQRLWLINEKTALVAVAIVGMWNYFGFSVLLAYSGIKSIPKQYYEAAMVDGGSFFVVSRKITIPLLSEVTKVLVITALVGGLYTFPQVFVMTGGGPGDITTTVMMYVYKQVFSYQKVGYGSALASIVILETFIMLFIVNRIMAREKIEF